MAKVPVVFEFRKVLMIDENREDIHDFGENIEEYLGEIEYTGFYINTSLEEIAEPSEEWESSNDRKF